MNLKPAISAPLPWLSFAASRLLAGKRRQILKLPRSLVITRDGKWYIGILLVIGVAAINTGNNLLYLIVATLLSLIIVSGIMSEAVLRGLRIERQMPEYAFRDVPVNIRLKATNAKKRVPSFSFNAIDAGQRKGAWFLKLRAGQTAWAPVEYTFHKRGRATLDMLRVSTRFPFGLFVKGKDEAVKDEIIVLPAIDPKKAICAGESLSAGAARSAGKGHGTGLYGLRDYTLMDDSRHIHWRSAARTQRLLLKEFEADVSKRLLIVFENYACNDAALFEELVERAAATAAVHVEKGWSVGLKTLKRELPAGAGRAQLMRILRELAVIEGLPGGRPSVEIRGV